ncbi:hypothetical protein IHQ56_02635 [Methylobacillus flagellatus]|uniref:hypothetical protein n=1 Tax=Methylobacillus flagellatus TaxID=405 RepID=UPI0028538CE1|nr:hypothetical protein [Methylobacillus flagellatus]MDR5170706.1 hypothetical protein [Methylobacillus flagellatus]
MAQQPSFPYQLASSRLIKINIESLVPPENLQAGGLFISYTFQVTAQKDNNHAVLLSVNLKGHSGSGAEEDSTKLVNIDTTIEGEFLFLNPIDVQEVNKRIPEMGLYLMPIMADVVESTLQRVGLLGVKLPRSFLSHEIETTKPLSQTPESPAPAAPSKKTTKTLKKSKD